MGKDFYEQTETGKAVFDKASELLGFSMPELCFTENDRLDITEYTQAAMVTTSIAMMKVLEERTGIKPDVAAGLSLGEYCALVAAGVMLSLIHISYAVILLLTENQDILLPTILSRCVQLKLKPLKDDIIKAYLMDKMDIPEEKADIYKAFARGNLGKAIWLASSEEFQIMYDKLLSLLVNLKNMDISERCV